MRFIDLFAGAGGLSEGFIRAGFTPIAHVEMDKAACFTLRTRSAYHYLKSIGKKAIYEAYLKGEVTREQLYKSIPAEELSSVINEKIDDSSIKGICRTIDRLNSGMEVDAIVGGPPCQAYSLVGRARDKNGMRGDERNFLYRYYARFLARYQPKVFVFENVLGLLTAEGGLYFENMKADFDKTGYHVEARLVNARDYGVLQNRRRIIIVGKRKDLGAAPVPEFKKKNWTYDVQSILSDLPTLQSGEGTLKAGRYKSQTTDYLKRSAIRNGLDVVTLHCSRPNTKQDREIYRRAVDRWDKSKERLSYSDLPASLRTHNNVTGFLDRFKVVAANEPASHTVVAHISKDGHHYIHPDVRQNRSLSVREAARLQSFPDDYYFEGIKETNPRTAAFKQIGNAVPPLLAECVANTLSLVV